MSRKCCDLEIRVKHMEGVFKWVIVTHDLTKKERKEYKETCCGGKN